MKYCRLKYQFAALMLLFAVGLPTLPATAQDGRPERGEGDRERRRGFDFNDEDSSATNDNLKRLLARFPGADEDKDGVLNGKEARAFLEKQRERWRERRDRRRSRRGPIPTHEDIAYGPEESQVIDLYLAKSEDPTPLVVYFHGGQFITGDEDDLGTLDVAALVSAGISVASVDYRDTHDTPFPVPFEDGAKAIQFLRYYAEEINIDPARIAGHGEEAGGNIALYLGLHDDLAVDEDDIELPAWFTTEEPDKDQDSAAQDDEPGKLKILAAEEEDTDPDKVPENLPEPWEDPRTAAESTRLISVVARHPIATFDPREWKKRKLPMNDHERLMKKYLDVRYLDPVDDEDVIALVEAVSPLALASADDPEVLLMNQYKDIDLQDDTVWAIVRHHPRQSKLIAGALKQKGGKATVRYRGMQNDPGINSVDFLLKMLK